MELRYFARLRCFAKRKDCRQVENLNFLRADCDKVEIRPPVPRVGGVFCLQLPAEVKRKHRECDDGGAAWRSASTLFRRHATALPFSGLAGINSSRSQYGEGLYRVAAFAPFGERYALKGAAYSVDSFTGKPDQTVSDEYDFAAREEHNGQGRWISPDHEVRSRIRTT